jgi:regulator of RNase E activity RraA
MKNEELSRAFSALSTPLIADAMLRLDLPPRVAPPGVSPLQPGTRLAGRVRPVRHYGSVDIFIEAMAAAEPGDVLVIDNRGRTDEACIGDLTALEARAHGLAGIVVWGLHRDTAALREIDFPVFSYGVCPVGPVRHDERESEALSSACFGELWTTNDDVVFADDDGVIFAPLERAGEVVEVARQVHETERRQAQALARGQTLYEQLRFREYLAKRATDPGFTFREHLREIRGAIEE